MPNRTSVVVLTIGGDESGEMELEQYANFLRDLVFIYDRLWMLSSKSFIEVMPKVYYSSFFYTRGHRPVPAERTLELASARIGSPFRIDLNIKTDFGESLEGAARAFATLLRTIATLPALVRRENLQNRLLEAAVNEEIHHITRRALKADGESLAEAAKALQSLPGLQTKDWEERISFLERDLARLTDSSLKIRSVEIDTKDKED